MRAALVLVFLGAFMWMTVYNILAPALGMRQTDATASSPAAPADVDAVAPVAPAASSSPAATGSPEPTPVPAAPSTATPTPPPPGTYVVASGDTMAAIAQRHNVTLQQLLAANPEITDPTRIDIGQQINIPE